MVAIELHFLAGRFHATPWGKHVNEGVPEWPPSPWRFLRALVSAWHQAGKKHQDPDLFTGLLNKLATPPHYRLPPATYGDTQHYMSKSKIKPNKTVETTLVFDTFVMTGKNDPVYMIWPDVDLNQQEEELLSTLLDRITYLGRAESWASLQISTNPPAANCHPCLDGEVEEGFEPIRVLCAEADSDIIANLEYETSEGRKRGLMQPEGASWIVFLRHQDAFAAQKKKTPAVAEMPFVDTIRFFLSAKPLPQVQDTLSIGELARRATMAVYGNQNDGANSPTLSGKNAQGKPLVDHQHAFFLAADEDIDGRLDHLTIHAPGGFSRQELLAMANTAYLKSDKAKEGIQLVLLGYGTGRDFSDKSTLFYQSDRWQSVTPFVLGRHPKFYRTGKPKLTPEGRQADGPEDQVFREWNLRRQLNPSLPQLISVEHIPHCILKGRAINWLQFRTWRRKRQAGPGLVCGFILQFESPVAGPIALGYGSHYGLGQFRPFDQG